MSPPWQETLAELSERQARLEAELIASSRAETAIQVALQRIDAALADAAKSREAGAMERAEMKAKLARLHSVPDEVAKVKKAVMGDDENNGLRSEFKTFRQAVIVVGVVIGGAVPVLAFLIQLIQATQPGQ